MSPGSARALPVSIGRYRIECLIGKGGMGEVYKAFDPSLDRIVALKTIAPDADNPVFLERLYREAKACGRLRHPGIVTVHDLGEVDGVVFIAMEYLEGQSLQAAINDGHLTFEQKIGIVIQMLDALQYAHQQGVVHRDIKPSNALLLPDGRVKLLDFGLARVARAESLTQTGSVMGTPYYMSPEQLKAQPADGRTDVYSTGVVAYELLTRRRAFDGDHITTVMLKVLSDPPPPMETAWSTTFPEIERIVNRAMAKSPDDRFATAEEMKNALVAFLDTARAEIARTAAEVTLASKRAVAEAEVLVGQGRIPEVETLLAKTLQSDPDSLEARALLKRVTATDSAPPTPLAPSGPPRVVVPPPTPAAPDAPLHASAKPAMWIAAAVVLVAGVATVGMCGRGPAPTGQSQARTQAPPRSPVPPQTAPTTRAESPATTQTPTETQPPDQPQPSSKPAPAVAPPVPTVAPPPPSPATTLPPPARPAAPTTPPAPASASRPAVFVEVAAANRDLGVALAAALKARGLAVASGPGAAGLSAAPSGQVTIRKSMFDNGITADYVGALTIRPRAGARQTLQFDGHALEFGEANARAAALRALAEQMADAIEKAAATPQKE